jgi:hypothetical protein
LNSHGPREEEGSRPGAESRLEGEAEAKERKHLRCNPNRAGKKPTRDDGKPGSQCSLLGRGAFLVTQIRGQENPEQLYISPQVKASKRGGRGGEEI